MPTLLALDNKPAKTSSGLEASIIILPLFLCGFLLARFAAPIFSLLPSCAFRARFGIPCPSCGATRVGLALAQGELLAALAYNPLFVIGVGILTLWSISRLRERWGGKTVTKNFLQKIFYKISGNSDQMVFRRRLRWLLIAAIVLNWLYSILSK